MQSVPYTPLMASAVEICAITVIPALAMNGGPASVVEATGSWAGNVNGIHVVAPLLGWYVKPQHGLHHTDPSEAE